MNTMFVKSAYLDSGSYFFDNVNYLPNGLMVPSGSVTTGTAQLEDGGTVDFSQLIGGVIYPFRSRIVTVLSGNLYLYNGSLMKTLGELIDESSAQLITEDGADLLTEQGYVV